MAVNDLQKAHQIAHDVLESVSADQLSLPTPCADWNVGQLIDHLIGAQHWACSGISGEEMTETGEGASAGDFVAAFDAAAARSRAAFEVDGALDRTVNPGFGDIPATALLGMATTDTFTHAWDLASATGQPTDLDSELAGQLLAASKASIQDAFRNAEGNPFGLEQTAPDSASPADQLAAFLGRSVG